MRANRDGLLTEEGKAGYVFSVISNRPRRRRRPRSRLLSGG